MVKNRQISWAEFQIIYVDTLLLRRWSIIPTSKLSVGCTKRLPSKKVQYRKREKE